MAWPKAGPEPGNLGIDWAQDVPTDVAEGAIQVAQSAFKAPGGTFLPVVMDLYNGEAAALEPQASFDKARDLACEPLKGTDHVPKAGPMQGKVVHQGAVMLRAQVVNDKQQVVFELDSRL